jgi:hypothetical protein
MSELNLFLVMNIFNIIVLVANEPVQSTVEVWVTLSDVSAAFQRSFCYFFCDVSVALRTSFSHLSCDVSAI